MREDGVGKNSDITHSITDPSLRNSLDKLTNKNSIKLTFKFWNPLYAKMLRVANMGKYRKIRTAF